MKSLILSLIISVFTVVNISAQSEIKNKDWLIKTLELKVEKIDYYQHIMFKTDGYVQMEGRVFGRWSFNEMDKTINIESRMIKEFNGIWSVSKITNKELVIEKGDTKMYMELYDADKIISENEKANIIGIWSYSSNEYEQQYFKFEKPNKFRTITITEDKSNISSGGGLWFYNSKNKTISIPSRRYIISGTSKLSHKNDTEIVFSNKNRDITLNRVDSLLNKKDIMPLDNIGEYLNGIGLVESSELLQEMIYKFEDSPTNINTDYLKDINKLVYNKKIYLHDINVYAEFPLVIQVSEGAYNESLLGFGASHVEKNNYIYPVKEAGTFDEVIAFDEVEVNVKAGKYLCNVYFVDFGEQKLLLYMIKDKPGVYAKIIVTEDSYNGVENTIYELNRIE